MFKVVFTAATLAVSAIAANADTISLYAPMQAASLHTGGVDMVVYYLDHDDHFEVVATYADGAEPFDPARLKMALVDGDDVNFGLPGQPQVSYGFTRDGDVVEIEANLVGAAIANAN